MQATNHTVAASRHATCKMPCTSTWRPCPASCSASCPAACLQCSTPHLAGRPVGSAGNSQTNEACRWQTLQCLAAAMQCAVCDCMGTLLASLHSIVPPRQAPSPGWRLRRVHWLAGTGPGSPSRWHSRCGRRRGPPQSPAMGQALCCYIRQSGATTQATVGVVVSEPRLQ